MTVSTSTDARPARAPATAIGTFPVVTTVVATRGRPDMLRAALRSILTQDYEGELEVLVVFDQVEIDPLDDVSVPENRRLRTLPNVRTPGLAGGRNTGILAASGSLIAFCDDDDEWLPGKLTAQIGAWNADPDAIGLATAITIESEGGSHIRIGDGVVTFSDFLASRVQEVHPSSLLWRRADLLGRVGLVDEGIPASYGEDYDLLLRATRAGHLRCVLDPLVVVHWNRASFFDGRWRAIADGLTYLLRKHPEFARSGVGTARIAAQVAFAHAALGRRRQARRWARSALRRDRRQLRAYAAMAVAYRLVPAGVLVGLVNRRGRGL